MESMDLDTQIAQASETLEKIAASEGIDLDKLSSDEIAELLGDLMGLETTADAEPESKQASAEQPEAPAAPQPSGVTVAEVGVALQKIAAAEGIDLSQVTPEQYGEMFDNVTAYLNSPQLEQDKVAAAEMQEKLAEADLAGRQFAQSFWNELEVLGQKEAAKDEEKEDEDHEKRESRAKEEAEKDASAKAAGVVDKVKGLFGKARNAERDASGSVGDFLRGGAKAKEKRLGRSLMSGGESTSTQNRLLSEAVEKDTAKSRMVARGAAGGTAAATAATGIAVPTSIAAASKRKREREAGKEASLEELATDRARLMLLEGGVNPDTGTKFASDDEVIDFLATEKLRAAGYEV